MAHGGCGWGGGDGGHAFGDCGRRGGVGGEGSVYEEGGLVVDGGDLHGFQSTLPGWGATAKMDIFAHDMGKIIHFQH